MSREIWTAVDRYLADLLSPNDAVLDAALAASDAAQLPAISVAPNQGKLLHLLARLCNAKRILEIGTLGGYSTIWLARALPGDGRLVTLEIDPRHAEVARSNFERAGLSDKIDLRIGPAAETLPLLVDEHAGPFDFIFIDADKVSTAEYFSWALRLARTGSVIVVDNVVRNGAVMIQDSPDANVQGVRRFFERVAAEPRVDGMALQTVGSKGYDGCAIFIVQDA